MGGLRRQLDPQHPHVFQNLKFRLRLSLRDRPQNFQHWSFVPDDHEPKKETAPGAKNPAPPSRYPNPITPINPKLEEERGGEDKPARRNKLITIAQYNFRDSEYTEEDLNEIITPKSRYFPDSHTEKIAFDNVEHFC